MELNRRKFLTGAAAGGSLLLAGCMNGQSYGSGHEVPDGAVANAPIPDAPSKSGFATMGSTDATVPIYYFGNYKCPFCAEFSTQVLPSLVEEYVSTGDALIQYRPLVYVDNQPFLGQDAPRLGHSDLAVWMNDPEQYWTFHEYVYANQPPESEIWGTTDNIMNFVEGSEVENTEQIREDITNEAYSQQLQETSQTASGLGITGTPLLWVDGTVVNGLEEQQIRNAIEESL